MPFAVHYHHNDSICYKYDTSVCPCDFLVIISVLFYWETLYWLKYNHVYNRLYWLILYCIVYIYFVLFRYILTSTLMIVSATHGALHMVHSVFNIKCNCSLVRNDE